MSQYKLVYYSGMNMNLVQGASEIVEADSFNDALSLKCSWPVFEARDHLSAAAQNPGTCVYYTEMWEAVLKDAKSPRAILARGLLAFVPQAARRPSRSPVLEGCLYRSRMVSDCMPRGTAVTRLYVSTVINGYKNKTTKKNRVKI